MHLSWWVWCELAWGKHDQPDSIFISNQILFESKQKIKVTARILQVGLNFIKGNSFNHVNNVANDHLWVRNLLLPFIFKHNKLHKVNTFPSIAKHGNRGRCIGCIQLCSSSPPSSCYQHYCICCRREIDIFDFDGRRTSSISWWCSI